MFRQDLFVLYVVCTIFAENGVRFGDFAYKSARLLSPFRIFDIMVFR